MQLYGWEIRILVQSMLSILILLHITNALSTNHYGK